MAENFVYILSEAANDELFYNFCLEAIRGESFQLIPLRFRKGGGLSHVRRYLRVLLKDITHSGNVHNTFFVVALDNDRCPVHPQHQNIPAIHKLPQREQHKQCRFCELEKIAYEVLGPDKEQWPIQGAIAVPVQMLESWLLLISNREAYENEASLPVFAYKSQALTRMYFAPELPKDQLKDLKDLEKSALNITSDEDFGVYCVEQLVPKHLAAVSPSFALFKSQVDSW